MNIPNKIITPLINDIKNQCQKNDISFRLKKSKSVIYEHDPIPIPSLGFFTSEDDSTDDSPKGILAVATNHPQKEWIGILLHESCHMDQFLENDENWNNLTLSNGEDAINVVFQYIHNKIPKNNIVRKAFQATINVELDCEKRTLKKIKQYNLQNYINIEEYIRKANSYIYFYSYAFARKVWWENTPPYQCDSIWKNCPKSFKKNLSINDKIPTKLLKQFENFFP